MRLKFMSAVAGCIAALTATAAPAQTPAPDKVVRVMIVGVYHMSNPGHDLHNMKADDVLAPGRQTEIAAITDALARFKPTRVGVEWPVDTVAERYPQYLAGTLAPSRNEVVQLGFRLAKTAGAQGVYSLDADGDFPYEAVKAYAGAHGMADFMAQQDADIQSEVDAEAKVLADKGIAAELRLLNDPARLKDDNAFYRNMLRVGGGADQPGADLTADWYRRNLLICANLVQLAKPGDRIVVFFGAGHAFLLRQCVAEMPGFELVEANAFLPQ